MAKKYDLHVLKTRENEMIYAWDLIQNDPAGLGMRNRWGVREVRLAKSWVMDAQGSNYCSLYLYISHTRVCTCVRACACLIIDRKMKL